MPSEWGVNAVLGPLRAAERRIWIRRTVATEHSSNSRYPLGRRSLGADPGRASAFDIALLDVFATSVHGIVHGFALASAEGITAGELAPFAVGIGSLLPEMITRFAEQIDAGEYPGERSTIASAQAGLRHVRNAARQHNLDVGALTAALAAIDQAIDRGHGDQGLSRLATVLRR